jgi:hypothetical protein
MKKSTLIIALTLGLTTLPMAAQEANRAPQKDEAPPHREAPALQHDSGPGNPEAVQPGRPGRPGFFRRQAEGGPGPRDWAARPPRGVKGAQGAQGGPGFGPPPRHPMPGAMRQPGQPAPDWNFCPFCGKPLKSPASLEPVGRESAPPSPAAPDWTRGPRRPGGNRQPDGAAGEFRPRHRGPGGPGGPAARMEKGAPEGRPERHESAPATTGHAEKPELQ